MNFCDWITVDNYLVAPAYIYPVSARQALALCKQYDCVLPTPKLVDLIWKQADCRIEPAPQRFTTWTAAEMNDPQLLDSYHNYVRSHLTDGYQLMAGSHKDVVQKNGRVGIYGWHRSNGKPIQPFYAGHSLDWVDYSQAVRLVKKC